MNKSEFLANLRAHLSVLPPEEQNELLEDYEAHFAFGLQSGRTEQEIVLELGDPAELAKEAIGNRFLPQEHVYWFGGAEPAATPGAAVSTTPSVAYVGLGILLIVVTRYAYKGMIRLSIAYLRWNVRIAKGDQ